MLIGIKRYNYDLRRLKQRYPDEAPPHVIQKALDLEEKDLKAMWARIFRGIRKGMGLIGIRVSRE